MRCFDLHNECDVVCDKKDCRQWIDYDDDLNCTILAIKNNGGDPMTLRQISDRIGVSFVRIKQIEAEALKKIQKKENFLKIK